MFSLHGSLHNVILICGPHLLNANHCNLNGLFSTCVGRNIQSLSLLWPESFTQDSLRYENLSVLENILRKLELQQGRSDWFLIWIIQPTVCHYFMKLLKDKGLLRRCYSQVWEGEGAPKLCECIDIYVSDQSEHWHSGACGWPGGGRPHWSSWNVLHIPLRQFLLPQGVHAGLDER